VLRHALLPKRTRSPPWACAPRLQPCTPPPWCSHPPLSTSLIVPPPVRVPLFVLLCLSFIHMSPYFIRLYLSFICVHLYFIRARPTLRSYAPLWQQFVPSIELCTLQPVQYNRSLHPTIQRGSDVAATMDKVTPVLSCQRSTWR
jgi:hypothetical protein